MARFDRDPVEIAQLHQLYDEARLKHGCGYYPVCYEHDCPCSPDAPVSKDFDINVWDRMLNDYNWNVAEFNRMMAANRIEDDDWPDDDDDEDWPDEGDWE